MIDLKPTKMVVYFQILEPDANNPYVRYWCGPKMSFGISKLLMIARIKQRFHDTLETLELVEVANLDDVTRRKGLWAKHTQRAMPAEMAKAVESLFSSHYQLGIPIRHTVQLVFKLLGLDIGAVCEEAGFHRNYLNASLGGKRQPSESIRAKMIEKIGLDPWAYAEWLEPVILNREILQLSGATNPGGEVINL